MSGKVGSITTSIVVDGLVLNMDAANRASYPKTGTTWVDTINGNNGTLINGPMFSSDNGGSIEFDGNDDSISVPNSADLSFGDGVTDSPLSISFWVNAHSVTNSGLVGKYKSGGVGLEYLVYFSSTLRFAVWDNSNGASSQIRVVFSDLNVWKHVTVTYDGTGGATALDGAKIYISGVEQIIQYQSNSSTYVAMENTAAIFQVGKYQTQYFNGNIANIQVYNKELSSQEVLQNYNALRGRFGL